MKHDVFKDEEGRTVLQLGLSNNVSFDPECTLEDVSVGVMALVEHVLGVNMVDLVADVMNVMQSTVEVVNDNEGVGG